jgi:SAM-dependent methyltransferase
VGAKETRLAAINIDVERYRGLDAICTVTHLPFKSSCFWSVLFADVIEHLPPKDEKFALGELARILQPNGRLLITTPNKRLLYKVLDPAWVLRGHRHYGRDDLVHPILDAGLTILKEGTFGLPSELLYLLIMYSTYPVKMIIGKYPDFLPKDDQTPDALRNDDLGYTRYALAYKTAGHESSEDSH